MRWWWWTMAARMALRRWWQSALAVTRESDWCAVMEREGCRAQCWMGPRWLRVNTW